LEAEIAVEHKIKTDSQFKSNLQKALKMGGQDSFKAIFNHPKIYISPTKLQSWLD
jgi:flotillin